MPRTPTHTFSMHGGAGAILSVGLMRQIPRAWFEDCVTTTYTTGGDAMISICLWEVRHLANLADLRLNEDFITAKPRKAWTAVGWRCLPCSVVLPQGILLCNLRGIGRYL